MERTVFFVSDRTGITAETLGHSLLAQFDAFQFKTETLRFLDTLPKARTAAERIGRNALETGARPIVFGTLIDDEIRRIIAASDCIFFDLVDTFIHPLETELHHKSSHRIGHAHGFIDRNHYNTRMDAVNYALATDDGLATRDYSRANVIILGVSRSGKTPTCLYMALTFGIYAANYPLTGEDLEDLRLAPAVSPYRGKLFGLSIDPMRLQQVRRERKEEGVYSSLKRCQYEVRQSEALFRKESVPFLETTAMSIEEIATTIMHEMNLSKLPA